MVRTKTAAPAVIVSRDDVLRMALKAAEQEDAVTMVRALEMPLRPPHARTGLVRELMITLAGQNLLKAGRIAEALPTGPMQTEAVEILAQERVQQDPDAAIDWALAITTPSAGFDSRRTVAKQLIERAPQAAMERFIALPPSKERNEILGYAGAEWVRRDATAALAWLGQLSPTDDKKRVATSIGYALALSEPLRATARLSTLPEGRDRLLAITAIGQTLVASDADEAWKWARQLPAGSAQEAAVAGIETGLGGGGFRGAKRPVEIVGHVGTRGIVSVSGSAGSMPLGSERDQALRRDFAEALRESPVRAASWLASIPIPDRRDEMVDELARRWLAINPEAARLWMDENNVAPGRRQQLLREAGHPNY